MRDHNSSNFWFVNEIFLTFPKHNFSDMGHPCILSTLEDQVLSLQFSCPHESLLSSYQGLESLPVSFPH